MSAPVAPAKAGLAGDVSQGTVGLDGAGLTVKTEDLGATPGSAVAAEQEPDGHGLAGAVGAEKVEDLAPSTSRSRSTMPRALP